MNKIQALIENEKLIMDAIRSTEIDVLKETMDPHVGSMIVKTLRKPLKKVRLDLIKAECDLLKGMGTKVSPLRDVEMKPPLPIEKKSQKRMKIGIIDVEGINFTLDGSKSNKKTQLFPKAVSILVWSVGDKQPNTLTFLIETNPRIEMPKGFYKQWDHGRKVHGLRWGDSYHPAYGNSVPLKEVKERIRAEARRCDVLFAKGISLEKLFLNYDGPVYAQTVRLGIGKGFRLYDLGVYGCPKYGDDKLHHPRSEVLFFFDYVYKNKLWNLFC